MPSLEHRTCPAERHERQVRNEEGSFWGSGDIPLRFGGRRMEGKRDQVGSTYHQALKAHREQEGGAVGLFMSPAESGNSRNGT